MEYLRNIIIDTFRKCIYLKDFIDLLKMQYILFLRLLHLNLVLKNSASEE